MHLLLNFDKLQKNLLKKYFLQIKEKLQQQNNQLQQQNTQLQQQNTQLQQQNTQLQQQSSQQQDQNSQLQQQNNQLQQQNTLLQQTTEVLKQQNNNLQDLINNSNLDESNLDEKKDYSKITYHYYTCKNLSPYANSPNIPSTTYYGSNLLYIYNIPKILPANNKTRKVKIAVIIAYHSKNLISDLNTYWRSYSNFGPFSKPPNINVYTFPGSTINDGWTVEACLDIQMIATINPNAEIWIVEAISASSSDLYNALVYARDKLNVDVISMSWGSGENDGTKNDQLFFTNPSDANYAKCYCASSGDNNYVCWPAVSSNVVGVGGTSVVWSPQTSNLLNHIEYTWSSAGCGFSKYVDKPQYQQNVNVNNSKRAIPDISLIANPTTGVQIVCNGKWYTIGGTSLSCPIFAGILSLANQQRFNVGKKPLTTVNSSNLVTNVQNALYNTIYQNTNNKNNCLTDVTQGTDGVYQAQVGYDIATGLGTPNAKNICNVLTNSIP
jgi:subtilase family serine protease